jgi:hypothetical protein
VGALLIWLLSGTRQPEPQPPLLVLPPRQGEPGGAPPPPIGGGAPVRLPWLADIPDVTLHPGEEHLLKIVVDRRGFEEEIELRVDEAPRLKAPGGAIPGPPGVGKDLAATELQIPRKAVIPRGSSSAVLRVAAGSEMPPRVHEFRVTAWIKPPPGAVLEDEGADGKGMKVPGAGPGGAPGMPGTPAGPQGKGPLGTGGPAGLPPGGLPGGPVGKPEGMGGLVEASARGFVVTVRSKPRSDPDVLRVGAPDEMQVDVVWGGVLVYSHERAGERVLMRSPHPGVAVEPARLLRPARLVVVSAPFPYREQLETFRKALHREKVVDLFSRPDTAPRFAGLNVTRFEVGPEGLIKPGVSLYRVGPAGRPEVHDLIQRVLTAAAFDAGQADRLRHVAFPGLVTPLPQLAGGEYPPLRLKGIEPRDGTGGSRPPRKGLPEIIPPELKDLLAKVKWEPKLVKRPDLLLPPQLRERLRGKVFPFDPAGLFPEGALEGPRVPGMSLPRPKALLPGDKDGGSGALNPESCLVRFFDVDPPPGKTYQYAVQVCMVNPNGGEPGAAKPAGVPGRRYLLSPAVLTPPVRVGSDFQFYVVDQHPLPRPGKAKGPQPVERLLTVPEGKIPVQFHQFVGVAPPDRSREQPVGAWLIAERLFVGRGEVLGRRGVEVEAAAWDSLADDFKLVRFESWVRKGKGSKLKVRNTLAIDFGREGGPVLVDFWGERMSDGGVEALVWGPDGTLSVRSAHEDSARPRTPEERARLPRTAERLDRHAAWRERVERARRQPPSGGVAMPGKSSPLKGP